LRAFAVALPLAALLAVACDNMLSGNIVPVPPVHRVSSEVEGKSILVAEDPAIESNDPVHLARAKEVGVARDFRASMTNALSLAGFKVVTSAAEPHDLVAKLALAVREEGGKVYQTYRCGLRAPDGSLVAQIDWLWPQGTYVGDGDVYDYATHNVATEITMSPRVTAYLRGRGNPAP
jgi:hypothetical protein